MQLQEVDSHKHLGLLFHNSLSWHLHIISLHQRAMRHANRLRSILNLVPRFAVFSIYNSFILPIFDYGSVVYDTCSQSDALPLDSAQTTAAKIITGCIQTTANDAVLNDISLVKLGTRREKHILLYYYKTMFGMASPTLHSLIPKMYKDLSRYMLRNSLNVQIPLAKKNTFFNSFFQKAASLWNALPVFVKSSATFSSFKLRLETFYWGSKHNCWHLHGSNPRNTSLRCRLRLGHSVLNLNKRTYRMCLCGNNETEEHLLLNCSLHSVLRVDLMQSVKSILLKEGLQDLLSSVLHDRSSLFQLLLHGHPSLKLKPTAKMYNAVSKYLELTNRLTSP